MTSNTSFGSPAWSRRTSAAGNRLPVGLFGLASRTTRVRGVTRASRASASAVQNVVARAGIGTHQQADQLVGASAADDPVGWRAMLRGDGVAQLLLAAIG